jgi:hypothetical protein
MENITGRSALQAKTFSINMDLRDVSFGCELDSS